MRSKQFQYSVKSLKIFGPSTSGLPTLPLPGSWVTSLRTLDTCMVSCLRLPDDDQAAGGNLSMLRVEEAHVREVEADDLAANLDELLDAVASGEQFIILRAGQPVARLVPAVSRFPDRSDLRNSIPPMAESATVTIRRLRDEPSG